MAIKVVNIRDHDSNLWKAVGLMHDASGVMGRIQYGNDDRSGVVIDRFQVEQMKAVLLELTVALPVAIADVERWLLTDQLNDAEWAIRDSYTSQNAYEQQTRYEKKWGKVAELIYEWKEDEGADDPNA